MRFRFLCVLLFLGYAAVATAEGLPLTVAGLTLGKDKSVYTSFYDSGTATPMADMLYLTEVKLKDSAIDGVRGGSVTYGNCASPGRILQLKLKFADKDEKLFEDLLKLYKKRFGKPDAWLGNAFNTVREWKWGLEDGEKRLTFTLAYSQDMEYRPGVSVKMTMRSWVDEERLCWEKKQQPQPPGQKAKAESLDLNAFVPHTQ